MSVFYNKSRNNWVTKYKDNGKWKNKYFPTEQEAISYDLEKKEQAAEKEDRLTFGELVLMFFKAKEEYHEKTKKLIIYFLAGYEKDGKHIEGAGEFLRDKYADSLNKKDLEFMRANLRDKTNASNTTINKYQSYIRAILEWGAQEDYLIINPWGKLKKLSTKKYMFTTTIDQYKKVIAESPEWLQWALYTAFVCSLRVGQVELFSLMWNAFNWRLGYVQLIQGKSGRVKRVYPPESYMRKAFERWQEDSKNGIPWVCHKEGKRVLNYRTAFDKAVKQAGLKGVGIRPYDIRHHSAEEQLKNGASIKAVSENLGHSDIATTARHYMHVTVDEQKRASASLPELME